MSTKATSATNTINQGAIHPDQRAFQAAQQLAEAAKKAAAALKNPDASQKNLSKAAPVNNIGNVSGNPTFYMGGSV